ncbi:hypothetical protein P7K49_000171 [Saguinus oedipus]|uniref:Uncharacterized protein n=1 Tax=Saguinus oedipus TaxID=9490 RepID=A0ABQ9WBG0_SAGOE|nr:hypothetical protein P7K49_000171 [Saguinus oedipus]
MITGANCSLRDEWPLNGILTCAVIKENDPLTMTDVIALDVFMLFHGPKPQLAHPPSGIRGALEEVTALPAAGLHGHLGRACRSIS